MKLEARSAATPAPSLSQSHLTPVTQPLVAGEWVELLERPNPYSGDQALLLCQEEHRWVAWVPNYGEIRLQPEQLVTH